MPYMFCQTIVKAMAWLSIYISARYMDLITYTYPKLNVGLPNFHKSKGPFLIM